MNFKKHMPMVCLAFLFCVNLAACKKQNNNTPQTELEKLPPITQTGANTFGCLVNGMAWTPNGRRPDGWLGQPNLSVYYNKDSTYRMFGINAGQYKGARSRISFGTSKILQIGEYKIDFETIDNKNHFDYSKYTPGGSNLEYSIPYESLTYRKGRFVITKLDNIFSGTFEIEFCKPNSIDTLRITDGRFDVKL
jgi:hypothetical protein